MNKQNNKYWKVIKTKQARTYFRHGNNTILFTIKGGKCFLKNGTYDHYAPAGYIIVALNNVNKLISKLHLIMLPGQFLNLNLIRKTGKQDNY